MGILSDERNFQFSNYIQKLFYIFSNFSLGFILYANSTGIIYTTNILLIFQINVVILFFLYCDISNVYFWRNKKSETPCAAFRLFNFLATILHFNNYLSMQLFRSFFRIKQLVVLCLYLEETLWMSTNWAYFRSLFAYNDMATLAALPNS